MPKGGQSSVADIERIRHCIFQTILFDSVRSWPCDEHRRVEPWRSGCRLGLSVSVPLVDSASLAHPYSISRTPSSNRTFGFPEYGFPIIFFPRLSQSLPTWPTGIVSTRVPESASGVYSISAISSSLPPFRNAMKVLPLPSLKVMLSLGYKRYYGQLRLPYRPSGISVLTLYPPVAVLRSIVKGLPCYLVWLPLRVAPGTPEVHLSVLAVCVKIGAAAFP